MDDVRTTSGRRQDDIKTRKIERHATKLNELKNFLIFPILDGPQDAENSRCATKLNHREKKFYFLFGMDAKG